MSKNGRHRLGSATHRLMESYKDDYPSHAQGILQEAIQNSVDARQSTKKLDDIVVAIRYDPDKRTLRIRDYGTIGMSHCRRCNWGTILGTEEDCHETDCAWGNFHYLGGLAKDMRQLGYRGQGKSLAVVAGNRLVVRTKVADTQGRHISMASRWVREGDDWYWELVPEDAMEPGDKPGTELIIFGVIDEVHEQLMDFESMKDDISGTWFPVLQKGTRIRLGYAGKELVAISQPSFPKPELSEAGKSLSRHRKSIPVSVYRKVVGELEDVELVLAPDPVPESMRGIALIKNGTQVIKRVSNWGRKIPLELQDRLYGWATYHCSDERPFLQTCERPTHRGYRPHVYYRKVKDKLHEHVEDFLLPFAERLYKPKLTRRDRKRARQNLKIIQRVLDETPEFNPWSGESIAPEPSQSRSTFDHPYISSITVDKEFYDYGDNAEVGVVVLNPVEDYQHFLHLTIEVLDEGLSQLAVWELSSSDLPFLKPASGSEKGRFSIEVDVPITEDFGEGRNWVRCTLLRKPPRSLDNSEEPESEKLFDRGAHSLWVGEEPVSLRRKKRGGGSGKGKRSGNLQNLTPITAGPFDPIEHEVMPMWSAAEIWFYTKGARIGGVYDSDPRTADSILYGLVGETIAERVIQLRMEEDVRESLDKSQILDEYRLVDNLRKNFLRRCEAFRSGGES